MFDFFKYCLNSIFVSFKWLSEPFTWQDLNWTDAKKHLSIFITISLFFQQINVYKNMWYKKCTMICLFLFLGIRWRALVLQNSRLLFIRHVISWSEVKTSFFDFLKKHIRMYMLHGIVSMVFSHQALSSGWREGWSLYNTCQHLVELLISTWALENAFKLGKIPHLDQ